MRTIPVRQCKKCWRLSPSAADEVLLICRGASRLWTKFASWRSTNCWERAERGVKRWNLVKCISPGFVAAVFSLFLFGLLLGVRADTLVRNNFVWKWKWHTLNSLFYNAIWRYYDLISPPRKVEHAEIKRRLSLSPGASFSFSLTHSPTQWWNFSLSTLLQPLEPCFMI